MITLDTSLLTSWYQTRAGAPSSDAAAAVKSAAQKRAAEARAKDLVAAPWVAANKPSETASKSRLASILDGKSVVTDAVASSSGARKSDQEQLFGAFRALEGLRLLAERAQTDGVGETEMAKLQERFRAGMKEVSAYLGGMDLQKVVAPIGASADKLEGVFGLAKAARAYVTGPVFKGDLADAVPGFANVSGFTIVANPGESGEKTIAIDFSQLGAQPRTLDTVVGFINGKLEAAGVVARLARVALPKASDAKATDPTPYGLSLTGTAAEELRFTPLQTSRSITALTSNGPANIATARITKLADDPVADPLATATANGDPLRFRGNSQTGFVARASAKGEDGATYVVGEATTPVGGNMGLRGSSDLTLTKFDSVGRRVWTRTLGVSDQASGTSVAVGADGRVVVAGSFKGSIETQTSQGESDAVVAAFDGDGNDVWVRKIGGSAADEARAVTIGADGAIYVGGRTKSGLSGANGGGWDGFLAKFDANGAETARRQFADAGDGGVTALAATSGGVVVAANSSGAGAVRKLDASLQDVWTVDAGPLGTDGQISAIAVNGSDIVIAGAVNATDVAVGGAQASTGGAGLNAFAARLTDGATPTIMWRRTFGGDLADSAAAASIDGGQVFIASTQGVTKADGATKTTRAAVSKIDMATGAETWTRRIGGEGERAVGVAADAAGASDLDAFGLPQGDLVFGQSSQPLVARTALREGDSFSLRIDGGTAKAITIEKSDTMASLVTKLNSVLRSAGKAEVKTSNDAESLVITAADGRRIDLVAGPAGKDALPILGLSTGEARKPKTVSGASASAQINPPVMPLNFRDDLAFNDTFSARKVRLDIERVQNAVRTAFEYIYNPPPPPSKAKKAATPLSTAAAEMQKAQLANYQAGLARLSAMTGISSTDTATSLLGTSF